jgi:adenylate cyclase
MPSSTRAPEADAVRTELDAVLQSADFDGSRRSREFLRFIVEETLAGRGDALSQHAIATQVFGRKDDFDGLLDPIVRIQAGRLRRSLERYYLLGGKQDAVRIELRKGRYAPVFRAANDTGLVVHAAPADRPSAAEEDPWPVVAVRAFECALAQNGDEGLASDVSEALTTELGRYRDVRVVLEGDADRLGASPRARARFDLRGALRREPDGWLVTARLMDRATGEQLWGDEYRTSPRLGRGTGSLDDVARVIAARVGAEHGVMLQTLVGEYRKRPAAATGAFGAILRSHHFFFTRDLADFAPAVDSLRQALFENPEAALAWGQLARLHLVNHSFELTETPNTIDHAIDFAYQGIRLDPTSTRIRSILVSALLVKGEVEAGQAELEKALSLNEGSLVYLEIIGYLMALLGDWERGIALVRHALERNPHHLPHGYFALWADHLRRGDFDQAYQTALGYPDPVFFWRSLMRASSLGHLGRTGEARAEVANLVREKPTMAERGRTLIGNYIKSVELQDRVAEGLRKAGLELA